MLEFESLRFRLERNVLKSKKASIAESAKTRIERARTLLVELVRESEAPGPEELEFETRHDRKTGTSELHAVVPQPPQNVAMLASEALHHLRSTLNMVATAAVFATAVDPEKIKRPQFPIFTAPEDYDSKAYRDYLRFGSEELVHAIRLLQPFSFRESLPGSVELLGKMNNFDKHTDLTLVATVFVKPVHPSLIGLKSSENGIMTQLEMAAPPLNGGASDTLIVGVTMEPKSVRTTFTTVHLLRPYVDVMYFLEEAPHIPLRDLPKIADDVDRMCESLFRFTA